MAKNTRLAGTHISSPAICWSCKRREAEAGGILARHGADGAWREQHHHAGQIGDDRRRHHIQGARAVIERACRPARRSRTAMAATECWRVPASRAGSMPAAHWNAAGQCQNRKTPTNSDPGRRPAEAKCASPPSTSSGAATRSTADAAPYGRQTIARPSPPVAAAAPRPQHRASAPRKCRLRINVTHSGTVMEAMVLNRMAQKNHRLEIIPHMARKRARPSPIEVRRWPPSSSRTAPADQRRTPARQRRGDNRHDIEHDQRGAQRTAVTQWSPDDRRDSRHRRVTP